MDGTGLLVGWPSGRLRVVVVWALIDSPVAEEIVLSSSENLVAVDVDMVPEWYSIDFVDSVHKPAVASSLARKTAADIVAEALLA
jgi:hypothetical protein